LAHTGTYGAEVSSTGSATYADEALPGRYYELYAQAWVYVASYVGSPSSVTLFGFKSSTGASIVNLTLSPTGKLAMRNNISGGTGTTTSTTMMPTGGWHSLALHLLVNATSGTADVSLDGNPVPLSATGNFGVNPVATFELGNAGTSTSSYDIAFDDVSVAQSLLTQPTAPILSATAADSAVSLSWTTPSDGGSSITGYYIYRGTSSGGESLLTTVGVTNSYSDTSVTNGTAYYYEVAAVNGVGTGALSTEVAETPQSPPAAPTGLAATSAKGKGVQLSWAATTGATSYRVYRSTTGATGAYTLIASVTSPSYKDTSTTRGVTYYYKVTAVNTFGESPQSNSVSATAT
jgi:hypothetical protein